MIAIKRPDTTEPNRSRSWKFIRSTKPQMQTFSALLIFPVMVENNDTAEAEAWCYSDVWPAQSNDEQKQSSGIKEDGENRSYKAAPSLSPPAYMRSAQSSATDGLRQPSEMEMTAILTYIEISG